MAGCPGARRRAEFRRALGARNARPRAYTDKVSAKSSPETDKKAAYLFRTTGKIVPPSRACPPQDPRTPGPGASNCAPPQCPPGTSNPSYCAPKGSKKFCQGNVRVTFKKKKKTTISKKNAKVRPDCSYKSFVTMKKGAVKPGRLKVTVRFLGNPHLFPKSAKGFSVRVGPQPKP